MKEVEVALSSHEAQGRKIALAIEEVRYGSEDCTNPKRKDSRKISCTSSLGFYSQAVATSTNVHRICATGHACAADAYQFSEIYVDKISGNKHINGNKAWGSHVSHLQLLRKMSSLISQSAKNSNELG